MADEQNIEGTLNVAINIQELQQQGKQAEKIIESIGKKADAGAKKASDALNKTVKTPSSVITERIGKRGEERRLNIDAERLAELSVQRSRRLTEKRAAEQRRLTNEEKVEGSKRLAAFRSELSEKNLLLRRSLSQMDRDSRAVDAVLKRSLQAPLATQSRISSILQAPGAAAQRQSMMSVGATLSQSIAAQLGAGGFTPQQTAFLVGGGRRPPGLTPPTPPGGGGGPFGRVGRQIFRGAATALGIGVTGFGAYAAVQAARDVVEASKLATAYERQRVAAEGLAGSQAQLNALLEAYAKASGGAVDKATSLSNVTRLLATGFAKTVPEAERFTRATRGASIALGRPQEYVTQETQLAISNTSVKRLDQIGLGIKEVTDRVEELRDANQGMTREAAFQEAVLSLMEDKYAHLTNTVEGQATGLERLAAAWANVRLAMGKTAGGAINAPANALARFLNPEAESSTRNFAVGLGENLIRALLAGKGIDPDAVFEASRRVNAGRGPSAADYTPLASYAGAPPPRFSDEILAGLNDFRKREADIEENYQAERLQAIEQYENQRTTIIRNYEKQIAREAEDFAIRRARSTRDYNKSVSDLIEDAAKRDEELTEDYTERVAEAREDSDRRIAEMQEDYAKEREKAAKDHSDRLLKIAGSLDAIALLDERRRWRREGEEREEAHKEQLQDARDALDEQLEDAREAYEERLADAREADAERLQDMEDSRRQQMEDEDADRALQLERAKEDHQDQLDELDRQHGLRMQQIENQARQEREKWQEEFEDFLTEYEIYVAGLREKRKKIDELTIEWLDDLRDELEKQIKGFETAPAGGARDTVPGVEPLGFASGGAVRRTGPAILHAGEFVLSRGMLAGTAPVPAAVANSVSNRSVVTGDIVVMVAPGSERQVGELLEEQLVEILNRVG